MRIPLTQGRYAIVDEEDYAEISKHKWYLSRGGTGRTYAARTYRENGNRETVKMHNQIMKPPPGLYVDHKSGDSLDNRRANLRICTHAENQHNQRTWTKKKSSEFKGVYWNRQLKRWIARINLNGNRKHLGCFHSEDAAAQAYDLAATTLFGEFARTNFKKGSG